MSAPNKATSAILHLTDGQSAFHALDRGTLIIVEEGVIHLNTQLYLAGLMFPQSIKLISGQSHLIEVTKYYQIMASVKANIILMPSNR